MPSDPQVDAYIEAQPDFARPILLHLRALVHEAAPDVGEAMKWSRPFFTLGGRPFCFLAAFKAHAAFGFWQGLAPTGREAEAAGSFGRLTSLADLPGEARLRALIAGAAANARAERPARTRSAPRPPVPTPDDLASALRAAPVAAKHFAMLPPGQRREYIAWIMEAKRPETRTRRITTTIAKLSARETLNARHTV